MTTPDSRTLLRDLARRAMVARGLAPDFSAEAMAQLAGITAPPAPAAGACHLRSMPWCSIDNDDSRDLDQLSVAEARPESAVKILVAVADVTSLVRPGTPLDAHARQNTTSVYTAAEILPMLPERLSTDLTSLNPDQDRPAIVVEMIFARDGSLQQSDVYAATVRNHAKLAYNSVAAWLEAGATMPAAIAKVPGLADNIRLQAHVAQQLASRRHKRGALTFETVQTRPVFALGELKDLAAETPNSAKRLIEDLMIAANGVTAQFLAGHKFPSIRRVVRTPERWDRIVALAAQHGGNLPPAPDARALEQFLLAAKAAEPAGFAALSLSVIKLLGAGEYVLELPGAAVAGHFGLAVKDYAHSTAPNRRFPDLITQRLLKAAQAGQRPPYSNDELGALALHCTEQEDAAKKVERQVDKSAAALLLSGRIGEQFDAVVTGASDKGVWVRLSHPPIEGKLVEGPTRPEVGDRLRVQLVHADVERGFLDFRGV